MPVSTSSGKVKFYIGDFGTVTTLPVPAEEQENTLTLEFSELISDQLAGWGDTPLVIYVLLDVDFNGNPWYENPEYADFPIAPGEASFPPTSADITITPDASPATSETASVLNYVPLVTDSSGKVSNGTYTVNAKFVFWSQDSGYSSLVTTFSANLSYGNTIPTPTFAYNSSSNSPFLRLTDSEDYTLGSTTPTYEGEFILYPPKNKAKITTLTEDVQSIEFSSFWTGGNEFELNVLLEYTYSTHDVILFKQAYEDFTIYKIDSCSIFNCLNSLYEKYKNTKCGTKMYAITQERMLEANSLALQLYSGQGCSEESLTDVLEDFEALCGCECECLSDEVTQIGAPNVVLDNDIQFVNAATSETSIDLSEGSTAIVSLTVSAGTTEIQATNITQYATYRFIFTRSFATQEATFESGVFFDGNGDVEDVVPTAANKVILTFFATTSTTLTLESRNDV